MRLKKRELHELPCTEMAKSGTIGLTSGQCMVPISPTSLLFCSCAGQALGETAHKDLLRRDPFRIIKKLGF